MSQPVILSASRRTDIPAFYSDWFMAQLRAGTCTYPNPMRKGITHTVDLRPANLSGMVFWSRWPKPLMQHLDELDILGIPYYFQFTLLGYPKSIEPHCPDVSDAIRCFTDLSDRLGPHRVIWRYDPVILADGLSTEWHITNFGRILDQLHPHTKRLVLSVIDPYPHIRQRLIKAGLHDVSYNVDDYTSLLTALADAAHAAGIREVTSCVEPTLNSPTIAPGRCIDANLLAQIALEQSGTPPRISRAHHKLRPGCLCHRSVDIGTTDTCHFGCAYCYATEDGGLKPDS